MLQRRLSFLSAFIFACVFPSAVMAETLDATSHVTAATIFSDRALVTRFAKVHVPTGSHVVALTDMPAGFDESSIRVQGKSAANVKIGTVDVKHVYLTEEANAAEREKTAALVAKNDEKAALDGEITALKAREAFITRIVSAGADVNEKDGASKLDFTPEKWEKAWTLIQSGMSETEKELAAKNVAMRKLDIEINKIQQELNVVESQKSRERRDVHINIEADQEADLELSLTYQTFGVTWRPVYDARLDTSAASLDLEQYGMASQQTGEDWNDIDLTLSTAQPAYGSEMPRISEWWVRLFSPMPDTHIAPGGAASSYFIQQTKKSELERSVMALAAHGSSMPTPINAASGGLGGDILDAEVADKAKEAMPQQAAVQSTEYAADFHVPGRVSLKSVRDASKMFIGAAHMKAGLASQISPRLTPQAYLFAKVVNGESYPFISGMVSKYRDGTFIGNAPLTLLRSGETMNLSFGVDDRVKVTYQRTHEEQANPTLMIVGDMRVERQYQTKVQNLHKDPITITVFEQYPVSADPDVKVELVDDATTQGYAEDTDKRQGVITWSGSYNPKEEKTFTIGFRVKYPKDRQINGL